MEHFPTHLREAVRTVSLRGDEKKQAFAQIREFMHEHPVRRQTSFFGDLFGSFRPMPVIAVALILVLGTGFTSAAASTALPGDRLYPVKIHFNERLEKVLVISPEAKAEFETKLAARRIAEANTLASSGRLDAQTVQAVSLAVERQSQRAYERIATLEQQESAAHVRAQLRAQMQVQRDTLRALATSTATPAFMPLADAMQRLELQLESQLGVNIDTGFSSAMSSAQASAAISTAEQQTAAMQELFNRQNNWTEDMKAKMKAQMEAAQQRINDAKLKLNAGQSSAAASIAAEAQTMINTTIQNGSQSFEAKVSNKNGTTSVSTKGTNNGQVHIRINGKDVIGGSSASASFSPSSNNNQNTNVETYIESNVQIQGNGSVNVNQNVNATSEIKIGD